MDYKEKYIKDEAVWYKYENEIIQNKANNINDYTNEMYKFQLKITNYDAGFVNGIEVTQK